MTFIHTHTQTFRYYSAGQTADSVVWSRSDHTWCHCRDGHLGGLDEVIWCLGTRYPTLRNSGHLLQRHSYLLTFGLLYFLLGFCLHWRSKRSSRWSLPLQPAFCNVKNQNDKQHGCPVRLWELIPSAYGRRCANCSSDFLVPDSVSFQCLHKGSICNHQAWEERKKKAWGYGKNIYSKIKYLLFKCRKISDPLCMTVL